MSSDSISPVPAGLLSPPDGVPAIPPTRTRSQRLPFEALSWENFERLCHRLVALDGAVEHCARYGRPGEAQAGIDIYARYNDGRYHCLQAKRHEHFGADKLRAAVKLFLKGQWASRACRFTLAVQAQLQSTTVQEEIERQAAELRQHNIALTILDGDALTNRLRAHPCLIDDFFGRLWVEGLLGSEAAGALGARLDGSEFARIRDQLSRVYDVQFQFVDPGSFGSVAEDDSNAALTLLERFCKPDLMVREAPPTADLSDTGLGSRPADGETGATGGVFANPARTRPGLDPSRTRRIPAATWLGNGDRLAVVGEAGSGKSTLLRVIALDLLHGQARFPEITERWGDLIPLYLPFARWSAEIAREGTQIGLKELVRRAVQPLLTGGLVDLLDRAIDERRVLLLLDGLDEWSDEQAARTTLSALVTTVEAHAIPTIVSGRPRGLSRIGTLPAAWKRAAVAPLAVAQQAEIAARWFERYAAAEPAGVEISGSALRTDRFMAELARDPSLSSLATVPLLLVGLVTLALRGQILPRTRPSIYDQLVRVLLEVHPINRATAAGDTRPRFRFAQDADQRRDAIARLAFAIRHDGAAAALPLPKARDLLRAHLSAPEGFALPHGDATAAANEILAVNAETQGLIVEKAAGEIGFVHASFEEYLCAEHIGGWPFARIEEFMGRHAGDGRWRNVLVNLLTGMQRRDEFDRLIAIIDQPQSDELLSFARTSLLYEIGVGSAVRAPATARRLALSAIDQVEFNDWLPARRDALATTLQGLSDPVLRGAAEEAIRRWVPASAGYRASLVTVLGAWPPSDPLRKVLWRALHDEDRGVQRSAAAAFANAFSGKDDARQQLVHGLAGTRDLTAATAMLESLALGWPATADVMPLFEEAARSPSMELRLVGLLGLAGNGHLQEDAKRETLAASSFWADVDYHYRELAGAILLKFWPNDDVLVQGALHRASGAFGGPWELDLAEAYLLRTPVDRSDVRAWIAAELKTEYPFNMGSYNGAWGQVGHFAAVDPDIREAVNIYWREPKNRMVNLHFLHSYVARVADDEMAGLLIELLPNADRMDRHWIVRAMLAGWGRDHPRVKDSLDRLIAGPEDGLVGLVALMAELDPDLASARARLLRIGRRADVRRDLLAAGLEACGCDHRDDTAVAVLLEPSRNAQGIFDPANILFRTFAGHPRIRALAHERMRRPDPPVADVARGYADDPEFAPALFAAAVPLSLELRTQIVEFAATGAAGTILEDVLAQWKMETDAELRARMTIAHFGMPSPVESIAADQVMLLEGALQVGPEYETRRATAFVGLIVTGGLAALAALKDRDEPVKLETGGFHHSIPSLERLICERLDDLRAAFGEQLDERFRTIDHKTRLAEVLVRAPDASLAARRTFLDLAHADTLPRTPVALRALAVEAPASGLLLERCFQALDAGDHRNDRTAIEAEIGLILRAEFHGSREVRDRLSHRFEKFPSVRSIAALAVFDPNAATLPTCIDPSRLGREFGDWAPAMHIAAQRADARSFLVLIEAMISRARRSQFDAQAVVNVAVEERLARDSILADLLSRRIDPAANPSISTSAARYLSGAGTFSPHVRTRASDLLAHLGRDQRVPVAGYDAISDQWRAARATLLDALHAGLDLS